MADCKLNLNNKTLENLGLVVECLVCKEQICPPVFQCQNGHLICSICLDKITTCPKCSVSMPICPIRNIEMDKVVKQNCPFFEWGCQIRLTQKNKTEHVWECEYRAFQVCLLLGSGKNGLECQAMVRKRDIFFHMRNEHFLPAVASSEAIISQEMDHGTELYPRQWLPITFSCFNENFFLDSEIIPDKNGSGATISWKCVSAGPVKIAKRFLVEMTLFTNHEYKRSLKYQGEVISIYQLEDGDLKHFSFSLSVDTLKQFCQSGEKMNWTIKLAITKVDPTDFHVTNPFTTELIRAVSIIVMKKQPATVLAHGATISSNKTGVQNNEETENLLRKNTRKLSRDDPLSPPPKKSSLQNDPIEKIYAVWFDVVGLIQNIPSASKFHSRKDKNYLNLDEILTRSLIKLDDIPTEGRADVRNARKNCVQIINSCIGLLESMVEESQYSK